MGTLAEAARLNSLGRFGEALRILRTAAVPTRERTTAQLLLAELLERTGENDEARRRIDSLLQMRLDLGQQATCERVLGRVCASKGDLEAAIGHLQRSITLATTASDWDGAAWAQCRLMLILSDSVTHEHVQPLLGELKQNVTRSGNPQLLANLHLTIAQMDGKRALTTSARRHAERALQILSTSPNLWLEALAEGNLVIPATLALDFERAIDHGHRAVELARQSCCPSLEAVGLANLGTLSCLTGNYDASIDYCKRALGLYTPGSEAYWGTLDALAAAHLAKNELTECERLLIRLEELRHSSQKQSRYVARLAMLTRCSLELRRRNFIAALDVTDRLIEMATAINDSWVCNLALLSKAHILMHLQDDRGAAGIIERLGSSICEFTPDVRGFYHGAIGCLLLLDGKFHEAARRIQRSRQVFSCLKHKLGEEEVLRRCNSVSDGAVSGLSENYGPEELIVSDVAEALESVVEVFTCRRTPLIAALVLDLFRATESAEGGFIVSRNRQGTEEVLQSFGRIGKMSDARRLPLPDGSTSASGIELLVFPTVKLAKLPTFHAITALVSLLAELERGRSEREERQTIWPVDTLAIDHDSSVLSGHMREIMILARRVARTNVSVLITGESGTGKEIVARAIHDYSDRAGKTFVPFNCAALPRDLVESQLFGYRRGAFTGAERDYGGVIRSANDGTLLLDEIGDLSPELQPKLLRFLESGEISPLGEPSPVHVNVRIIAATNTNLGDALRDGRFREDLFYRLNVVRLSLRPLRERRDEIPGLVTHFVTRFAGEFQKGHLDVAEETLERLLLYRWPGNVRQLQNEIRRIVALAEPNSTLRPAVISDEILDAMPFFRASGTNGHIEVPLHDTLASALACVEREMIRAALREHHGRVDASAKALGISRKGLYLKRQRFGL